MMWQEKAEKKKESQVMARSDRFAGMVEQALSNEYRAKGLPLEPLIEKLLRRQFAAIRRIIANQACWRG